MAWMEHGSQISLKRNALSMEDKMAAGSFVRATYYRWEGSFNPLIRKGNNNNKKSAWYGHLFATGST